MFGACPEGGGAFFSSRGLAFLSPFSSGFLSSVPGRRNPPGRLSQRGKPKRPPPPACTSRSSFPWASDGLVSARKGAESNSATPSPSPIRKLVIQPSLHRLDVSPPPSVQRNRGATAHTD